MTSHFKNCLHAVDRHDQSSVTQRRSQENMFSTNNMFHSIITVIKVVLCKNNEEINFESVFYNHVTLRVVRIWLRNRSEKLPWKRNKNTALQMSCLEYIVWYGQFVTNWYDFTETPFYSTKFLWRLAKSLVIWVIRVLWQSTKWHCYWCIGEDVVIFLLSLKQIRLHLRYEGLQQVLI